MYASYGLSGDNDTKSNEGNAYSIAPSDADCSTRVRQTPTVDDDDDDDSRANTDLNDVTFDKTMSNRASIDSLNCARGDDAGDDAIRWGARAGGWLLDRTYSGKGLSGAIGRAAEGRWSSEDRIVFVHTGGWPAMFADAGVPAAPSV